MPELADLDAAELLAAFRAKQATPEEAVASCIRRIRHTDERVGAVVSLVADQALEDARLSTGRWNAGRARRLEGVPYGVKDLIASRLTETRAGTPVASPLAASGDATVVSRLSRAGGVLLAKLATFEYGAIPDDSTRNPWALDHTASGSSSGPAAAVASRQLPVAIGSDTGGSILTPSAVCGVTGLKPTLGRVPHRGVIPLSSTLDHVGPITRSARDTAMVLEVLAGLKEGSKPDGQGFGLHSGGVGGLRLGVPADWFFATVDEQVAQHVSAAIRQLVDLGMELQEVEFPSLRSHDPNRVMSTLAGPEIAAVHADHASEHSDAFERLLQTGRRTMALDYLAALAARQEIKHEFNRVLDRVDVVAAPGCVTVAPEAGAGVVRMGSRMVPPNGLLSRIAAPLNLAGLPAITIPVGFDYQGLPVGLVLFARPSAEAVCIRVAYHYQQATGHHLRIPKWIDAAG